MYILFHYFIFNDPLKEFFSVIYLKVLLPPRVFNIFFFWIFFFCSPLKLLTEEKSFLSFLSSFFFLFASHLLLSSEIFRLLTTDSHSILNIHDVWKSMWKLFLTTKSFYWKCLISSRERINFQERMESSWARMKEKKKLWHLTYIFDFGGKFILMYRYYQFSLMLMHHFLTILKCIKGFHPWYSEWKLINKILIDWI